MNELIDFNALQNQYIEQNLNFDRADFATAEEYEDAMLERSYELSEQFLNEPSDSLDGKSPVEFFEQMNAKELLDTLYSYYLEMDDMPDAIVQVLQHRQDAAEGMLKLLKDDQNEEWFRISLIDLLLQLEYKPALKYYCDIIFRSIEHDDLADAAVDALKQLDGAEVERELMNLFDEASDDAKYRMLDLLAVPNCDDKIFEYVLHKLTEEKGMREIFAYYIGRIDDSRALPFLHDISEEEDLDYVDYMEIRNAIERLGGSCIERDYRNDPLYAKIHGDI